MILNKSTNFRKIMIIKDIDKCVELMSKLHSAVCPRVPKMKSNFVFWGCK